MFKFFVLAVAGTCGTAFAQTPASNPMPDGSRDMYIGLGVQAVPRYEGAAGHRNAILPVLQVAWSNGLFVSGMSAGMHWSPSPSVEYGPLIALAPGRDASGNRLFRLATAGDSGADGSPPTTWLPSTGIGEGPVDSHPIDENVPQSIEASNNRLEGMATIGRRVVYGGFANVYMARQWRLTGNVLYGAGNDRRGLRAVLSIQHLAQQLAPHHALSLSAGVSLVNRAYNQAYFGVTEYEAGHTMNLRYAPDGGLQDVRVAARWNWALSPSWMLTTGMQASRLLGDAKRSPLVERATNLSASSALAYRF
ncbi:MipA/OmpV family protein [[Empedobacter] haloabium]|uniref:MipA/OmpV family protein n=1 Tax=[Empedobacter] haloabium TaxID=592317 RepID=A0ABZ1UKF7_9BURK